MAQTALSNGSIRQLLRARMPETIERLVALSASKNPNVSLGACRVMIENVLPKLKSIEITGADPSKGQQPFTITVMTPEAKENLEKLYDHQHGAGEYQTLVNRLKREPVENIKTAITLLGEELESKGE